MQANFLSKSEYAEWQDAVAIVAGCALSDVSIVAKIGITTKSGLKFRVDIQANAGYSCFKEIRCVGGIVYIGYGKCIFVIHANDGRVETHLLDGYFGHIYGAAEYEVTTQLFSVLVTSASELLSFSLNGDLQWRASELGVDGVTVRSVTADVVTGSGDWEPPGGWIAFKLSASTGEKIVV